MRFVWFCLLVAALLAAAPAHAQSPAKTGVVLIHGKEGFPDQFTMLTETLAKQGYEVERPEMCWSFRRIYDKPYLDCIGEIDAAVAKLKDRGAQVVVWGVGLGGNAALAYGARREGLKGIVAVVPAHAPELTPSAIPDIAKSLTDAHALIAAGKGAEKNLFADRGSGHGHFLVNTTPNIYVTFFGADSPGVMPDNASKLKAPLLILTGTHDPSQRSIPYVFARAPKNLMNRYVAIQADHRDTIRNGRQPVLDWLKELSGN